MLTSLSATPQSSEAQSVSVMFVYDIISTYTEVKACVDTNEFSLISIQILVGRERCKAMSNTSVERDGEGVGRCCSK